MRTYRNVEEIREANAAAGLFFFSPSTMRFFDSRVGSRVYGGRYFVTSERFSEASPRLYTVRRAEDDGSIEDASGFQEYTTAAEARLAAIALARVEAALTIGGRS